MTGTITFDEKKRPIKKYPTIAPCGLNCGFCPRFYTDGPSRCPGCSGPGFYEKHPTCSIITCCVKTRQFEVCSECPDFPCGKFKPEQDYEQIKGSNSYPSCNQVMVNLKYIKEKGLPLFLKMQNKRMELLKRLLSEYDDGRSKSYYCHIAETADIGLIKEAIGKADEIIDKEHGENDVKVKAKILKGVIGELTKGLG